jgi:hypothetical protein
VTARTSASDLDGLRVIHGTVRPGVSLRVTVTVTAACPGRCGQSLSHESRWRQWRLRRQQARADSIEYDAGPGLERNHHHVMAAT